MEGKVKRRGFLALLGGAAVAIPVGSAVAAPLAPPQPPRPAAVPPAAPRPRAAPELEGRRLTPLFLSSETPVPAGAVAIVQGPAMARPFEITRLTLPPHVARDFQVIELESSANASDKHPRFGMPGELFSADAMQQHLSLCIGVAQRVELTVRNVSGRALPFRCALQGWQG